MRTLLLVVVLLAGCAACQGPSPTTGVTGSPPPTATSSATEPTASPSPSPAAVDLAKDSIAKVLVDKVVVFDKPPTSTENQPTEDSLSTGDLVYVVDGPVEASGSQWYEVAQVRCCFFGWVQAAGPDGPWLGSATLDCPSTPLGAADMAAIDIGSPSVGLLCFGDRPLTLTARIAAHEATCGVSPGWTTDPAWLGPCEPHDYLTGLKGSVMSSYFDAVLAPNVSAKGLHYGIEPKDWLRVRITGQFDFPAARTCRGVKQDSEPPPPASVILGCRSMFVITSIQVAP
jgi:hypothetical protein